MTFSVDGKTYKGNFEVMYKEDFIKQYRNYQVELKDKGKCNIYLTYVGEPSWTDRWSIVIPVKFYITVIYDKNKKVKDKGNHLRLVK